MKKELTPAILAVGVVVALLILIAGWYMMNREPAPQNVQAAAGAKVAPPTPAEGGKPADSAKAGSVQPIAPSD